MKSERIGTTPRDQLKWVLRVVSQAPRFTEGDWLNFELDALAFAGIHPTTATPIRSAEYRQEMLDALSEYTDEAIAQDESIDINALRRPKAPKIRWDKTTERFKEIPDTGDNDYFETKLVNHLGELILRFGHLLKICQAPRKQKPGPKPKNAIEQPRGICENRFLALKRTQRYCSPRCLDRALKQKKAPERKKPKVRKKRPKK